MTLYVWLINCDGKIVYSSFDYVRYVGLCASKLIKKRDGEMPYITCELQSDILIQQICTKIQAR